MADEKMVSEREAVLRERKAGEEMVLRFSFRLRDRNVTMNDIRNEIDALYPLPVKKRPLRIRLSDGNVWHRPVPDGRFWCWEGELIGCVYSLGDLVARISATPDDLCLLARCLDGELEDIPEGEE